MDFGYCDRRSCFLGQAGWAAGLPSVGLEAMGEVVVPPFTGIELLVAKDLKRGA